MGKYMSGGSSGAQSSGGYDQYMKQYAGGSSHYSNYSKYSQTASSVELLATSDDTSADTTGILSVQATATADGAANAAKVAEEKVGKGANKKFLTNSMPLVRNESDPASWREAHTMAFLPELKNQSDIAEWREVFLAAFPSNVPQVKNQSDPASWREAYMKKYLSIHVKNQSDPEAWRDAYMKPYESGNFSKYYAKYTDQSGNFSKYYGQYMSGFGNYSSYYSQYISGFGNYSSYYSQYMPTFLASTSEGQPSVSIVVLLSFTLFMFMAISYAAKERTRRSNSGFQTNLLHQHEAPLLLPDESV